jgi:dihydroneopterin aldolase
MIPDRLKQGPYRCVALRDFEADMSIGIVPWERERRQRVCVDVEMWSPLPEGPFERLDQCIDYDRVHAYLAQSWTQRPHTDLLETLADELLRFVLEDPQVEAARVTVRKPEVYPGPAQPEVQFFRERS